MLRLHLQAVDSQLATSAELEAAGIDRQQIPTGADGTVWQLTRHQVATVRALREGNAPLIINRAMTGDGKTLAGRFPLLSDGWKTFAMYPTNALAYDQYQGFDDLLTHWVPPRWKANPLRKRIISAREIDDFASASQIDASRRKELEQMMRKQDYILTNPDIFHLIMNFAYKQQGEAGDVMPTFVANRFQLYIFDEFHLFGIEQTASVMIAMLLLRRLTNQNNPPRFLFLSATPQRILTMLADRVGLPYESPIEGSYQHGQSQPPPGHRRILQATSLALYPGRLEEWIETHFEDTIKPFFMENRPAAKGVIIANSVATAHRVHAYLKPLCQQVGIDAGINTGLTPKVDRSTTFDLLVATSTVDVGVDFKINFLVFESRDAASHTQRLGRLGRHTHDADGNHFQTYEAHALLPPWVVEGLAQNFADGSLISREEYQPKLEDCFPARQQFTHYIQNWAGIQAGKVLHELRQNEVHTQYRQIREILEQEFKTLFGGHSVNKYFTLTRERVHDIVRTASAFRGGSPFTALIQDPETGSQEIVSYSLMTLLRRAQLHAVSVDDLLREAGRRGQNVAALSKTEPLAAYQLVGWCDDYRRMTIHLDAQLPDVRCETVIEQNRFIIDCPGIPGLQRLNDTLYQRTLVAFIITDKDPFHVRRILNLNMETELFDFSANGGVSGTVIFGRDALLIESVFRQRKKQGGIIW